MAHIAAGFVPAKSDPGPVYNAMKTRRAWLIVLVIALQLRPIGFAGEDQLNTEESRGRRIYQEGRDGSSDGIVARLGLAETEVSAGSFPCIHCHGLEGEGSIEGGLRAPGLNWNLLTLPSNQIARSRAAYDETTLLRAISSGMDSSGAKLHAVMPRYRMSEPQYSALIAYLKKLGSDIDTDPGIDKDTIRLGTELPLSGPQASTGLMLQSTLLACIAVFNSKGGIYGRKLELVAADSESNAENGLSATRRLLEKDMAFALIASYQPEGYLQTDTLLEQSNVPLIGAISLDPETRHSSDSSIFHLLPGMTDQARALVEFLTMLPDRLRAKGRPKLAVVQKNGDAENAAAVAVGRQAKNRGFILMPALKYERGQMSSKLLIKTLKHQKADAVFFFGGASEFAELGQALATEPKPPFLLSLVAMVGRGAFELPIQMRSRTYLATPFAMNDARGLEELAAILKQSELSLVNPGLQAQACATVNIFAEAAKQAGRHLSRVKLVNVLEKLQDFRNPLLPPMGFSPSHHHGSSGAFVVGIDAVEKRFIPVSGWVSPAEDLVH